MEINDILGNEYFLKIIVSIIPLIIKGLIGKETDKLNYGKIVNFIYYALPILTIVWINFDDAVDNSKFSATLIGFNFALLIFTHWQQKLNSHYELISKFTSVETDKIKQINNINAVQVEKVKAINDNQKYILGELSRINDRIINFLGSK